MPTPKSSESESDFMGRCMGFPDMQKYPSDQRAAICHSKYRNKSMTIQKLPGNFRLQGQAIELSGEATDPVITKRRYKMHAYTGKSVEFFGIPMVFDLKGMEVSKQTVILQQHNHEKIISRSENGFVDDSGLYFEGNFYKTAAAGEVIDLAGQGFPWQASMGVQPLEAEFLDEGQSRMVNSKELKGPGIIVIKSRVKESSFVPLGADDQTSSLVFADDSVGSIDVRRCSMSEPKTPEADPLTVERKRVSDIIGAFTKDPSFANKHIGLGSSLLEAKAAYAEELEKKVAQLEARPMNPTVGLSVNRPQGSAQDRWNQRLKELASEGKTKSQALRHLAIHEPELHAQYLEEFNASYVTRAKR